MIGLLAASFALASPQDGVVIPLWAQGAPGSEARAKEPEEAKEYWVKNVHNPSLTAFLPAKDKATGTAVIIAPGGGHRLLVFGEEGTKPAKYLQSLGIASFVLKYRLFREENSTYTFETMQADAYRAMRTVKARASEWGVDPKRVGMLGFSAGGETVSICAYGNTLGDANAADPIDRLDARPAFQMLVYPGPLGVPAEVPTGSPPAFIVVSNEDGLSEFALNLTGKLRKAKVPVELHLMVKGEHGFNMGDRSKLVTVRGWPQRMADWLTDGGWLQK